MPAFPKLLRPHRSSLRLWLVLAGLLFLRFHPLAFAIGSAAVLAGAGLRLWAKGHLSQRERLTTTGPYAVTRNPFYLGNLILDLGLCTMIGRVEVALPYVVLWLWFHIRKIRDEERDLALLFGQAYAAYKERVPRLIPWRLGNVVRLRAADARFLWASRNLSSRKDIPRFLVALSYPFLFLARHQLAAQGIPSLDLADPLGLCMLLGFLLLHFVARVLRRPLQRRHLAVLAARAQHTQATPS